MRDYDDPTVTLTDVNLHLADIATDLARVRQAANDDQRPSCISADKITHRLTDVSNALDDLYNEIVGI